MTAPKYKVYRVTVDVACTTDTEAEREADRMTDSGPFSETVYGGKVVSVERQLVEDSAFAGDEMFEAAQQEGDRTSEENPSP